MACSACVGMAMERWEEGINLIYGIGTDIVEIDRIRKALDKKERFLERFFSVKEQEMIRARGTRSVKMAAANFAGKEAVSKALGTGIGRNVRMEEIEILRKDTGAPFVRLLEGTSQYAESCDVGEIHISLSDTDTLVVAYAVACLKDEGTQRQIIR